MAIFIDGLNEYVYGNSEPQFTKQLTNVIRNKNRLIESLSYLPMVRIVDFFKPVQEEIIFREEGELKEITQRYFANKRLTEAISNEYNIKDYFVIQPVPTYKYNLSNHIIFSRYPDILDNEINNFLGYKILEKRYRNLKSWEKRNVIWLADMQKERN
ncbi:MAG: hypothetical protein IIA09_04480, partial [Proteobacteria bacterium]|nr:hypothetical protein [Pseudomonadota bacterium]